MIQPGPNGFDGSGSAVTFTGFATYRAGPEGDKASAITYVVSKVKALFSGFGRNAGFAPSFA